MMRISRRSILATGAALPWITEAAPQAGVTYLRTADARDVRISIWPARGFRRGTILFSHGALSAPEKYVALLGPWSEAGFEILAPLHVDSTEHPDHGKFGMLESWAARLLDMRALAGFVGASAYIAAGHSYGALVALTLGGAVAQVPPGVTAPLRDRRARSVVAFSPPGATPGLISREGYAGLDLPALIETGDQDIPYGSAAPNWRVHLDAYDVATRLDIYALVLNGVDHYFGGLICQPDRPGPGQDAQLAQAVAVSIDFMTAYGAQEPDARARLERALTDQPLGRLMRK